MSIHFNWGPPGSYKTAHSLSEAISILLGSTRFFITNIKGFSPGKAQKVFGRTYPDFILPLRVERFFNISTEFISADQQLEVTRFFPLWAPFGSYLLIDEVQLVFPKNFSERDFTADFSTFNIPDYVQELIERFRPFNESLINENISNIRISFCDEFLISQTSNEFSQLFSEYLDTVVLSRPSSFLRAFSMHRHYGWDLEFTCQDLSQLSRSVLAVAEGAHYQQNLALKFGILGRGKYKRFFHSTQRLSPNPKDSGKIYTVDTRIFKCYSSTSIGQFSDTMAGQSPWFTRPFLKLYFLTSLLLIILFYLLLNISDMSMFMPASKKEVKDDKISQVDGSKTNSVKNPETVAKTTHINTGSLSNSSSNPLPHSQITESSPNLGIQANGIQVNDGGVIDDFLREDVFVYISGYILQKRRYRYAGQLHYSDGSVSSFEDLPPTYYAIPYSRCYYALYRLNTLVRYVHCPPSEKKLDKDKQQLTLPFLSQK